ncbi:hypothetical protein IW261DRAFT_1610584 [Armillaria novae-zelandiae]|uniref:Uncharacterized protein n=1 Tax=Armillaria novae-zelandiae TaxID=153914 RepID=A0AA39T9Q0_9AGAR|nr:hypothetical protein IW261DRAFT_1610584 [Armillaria novae-zelandiae]
MAHHAYPIGYDTPPGLSLERDKEGQGAANSSEIKKEKEDSHGFWRPNTTRLLAGLGRSTTSRSSSIPSSTAGSTPSRTPTWLARSGKWTSTDIVRIGNARESSASAYVIRSAGPKLLKPVPFRHPIADVQRPVTHALGLLIAAQATPNIEGTGGFFMIKGGDSKKLLLV